MAEVGRYIKDADVIDDGETRILLYTTNGESGEDDNVIAIRTASYVEEKGWLYGDESIAVVGDAEGLIYITVLLKVNICFSKARVQ